MGGRQSIHLVWASAYEGMRIESAAAPTCFSIFHNKSFQELSNMQVHKDLATTVRRIRDLAARADQIARAVEGHRVRLDHGGPVGVVSVEQPHRTTAISQFGQFCRDFHSVYATAFAALPPDMQKQIAAT
jgi:hypothetical protein